jgi:hypothetical protein
MSKITLNIKLSAFAGIVSLFLISAYNKGAKSIASFNLKEEITGNNNLLPKLEKKGSFTQPSSNANEYHPQHECSPAMGGTRLPTT